VHESALPTQKTFLFGASELTALDVIFLFLETDCTDVVSVYNEAQEVAQEVMDVMRGSRSDSLTTVPYVICGSRITDYCTEFASAPALVALFY